MAQFLYKKQMFCLRALQWNLYYSRQYIPIVKTVHQMILECIHQDDKRAKLHKSAVKIPLNEHTLLVLCKQWRLGNNKHKNSDETKVVPTHLQYLHKQILVKKWSVQPMHIVFHSLSQMSLNHSQGCNNIATPFNQYCHQ